MHKEHLEAQFVVEYLQLMIFKMAGRLIPIEQIKNALWYDENYPGHARLVSNEGAEILKHVRAANVALGLMTYENLPID